MPVNGGNNHLKAWCKQTEMILSGAVTTRFLCLSVSTEPRGCTVIENVGMIIGGRRVGTSVRMSEVSA